VIRQGKRSSDLLAETFCNLLKGQTVEQD